MPIAALHVVTLILGLLGQPGLNSKQSADDVVNAILAAKGGAKALKALVSVKRSGSMTVGGSSASVVTWAKRPNLFRREIDMPGLRIVVATDGRSAWSSNGDLPGTRLTGEAADRVQEEAAFEPALLDYAAKGHRVELVGSETQGKRVLRHLKLLKKNGKTVHYYVDAETAVEVRLQYAAEHGGSTVELTKDFSDYRDVNGVQIPFVVREFANGVLVSETILDSVEVNKRMEDAIFRLP